MSLDLSDGDVDPVLDEAKTEASDIVFRIRNMTLEEYAQHREELLGKASNLHKLNGGLFD